MREARRRAAQAQVQTPRSILKSKSRSASASVDNRGSQRRVSFSPAVVAPVPLPPEPVEDELNSEEQVLLHLLDSSSPESPSRDKAVSESAFRNTGLGVSFSRRFVCLPLELMALSSVGACR